MKKVRLLSWAAVVVAGIALFAGYKINAGDRTTRGELGQVPAFSFTDQLGQPVSNRDLAGKVWVANFVFTRCPSVCPLLTAKFSALQTKIGPLPDVRFVSFSVDPEFDTPEVLKAYAARFEADPKRWSFLTGPIADIEKTVVDGFKVHMGEASARPENPTLIDIMHGEHFVLVDQTGTIRGYYRSDAAGLSELASDLQSLR